MVDALVRLLRVVVFFRCRSMYIRPTDSAIERRLHFADRHDSPLSRIWTQISDLASACAKASVRPAREARAPSTLRQLASEAVPWSVSLPFGPVHRFVYTMLLPIVGRDWGLPPRLPPSDLCSCINLSGESTPFLEWVTGIDVVCVRSRRFSLHPSRRAIPARG